MTAAYVQSTQIVDSSMTVIDQAIQEILRAKGVLVPTCENWSFLAPKGAKAVRPLRSTALVAGVKAEGSPVEEQVFTLSNDDINLDLHYAVAVRMEDFANQQCSVASLEAWIGSEIGKAFMDKLEALIYAKLKATSASGPDHRISFTGTTVIDEAKILAAMALLDAQNVPEEGRYLAINPAQHIQMLAIDRFTRADAIGSGDAIRNGRIGYIHGFQVVKSTNVTANEVVAYHSSHVGFAIQMGLELMRQRAPLAYFAEDFGGQMIFGLKTMDSGKRGVLINASGA